MPASTPTRVIIGCIADKRRTDERANDVFDVAGDKRTPEDLNLDPPHRVASAASRSSPTFDGIGLKRTRIEASPSVLIGFQGAIMKSRMSGIMAVFVAASATSVCSCGSSTPSSPTGTPPVQVIWQNGALGCWAGNCGTGGMAISDQFFTHQTTASNTLEIDGMPKSGSGALFGSWVTKIQLLNTENQSGYANGHLEFDVMLAQPASAYAGIGVSVGNGCPNWVQLSPGALSQTSFTHLSVPLPTCTINYPTLFEVTLIGNSASSSPVLYLNNIEWITN